MCYHYLRFILIWLVVLFATTNSIHGKPLNKQLETLFIKVRLNDKLELDCTEFLRLNHTNSAETHDQKAAAKQIQPIENLIFIFKKNKIVFKMHNSAKLG